MAAPRTAAGPAFSVDSGSASAAGSGWGMSAVGVSTAVILAPALGRHILRGRMDRPLRVGLNLAYLVRRSGGAGTYARELIPELLELGARITAFASRELDPE